MNETLDKANALLDKANVITWVFLLYAAGGLAVVLAQPETMDFNEYSTKLLAFGSAIGLARGYASGKRSEGGGRAAAGGGPVPRNR